MEELVLVKMMMVVRRRSKRGGGGGEDDIGVDLDGDLDDEEEGSIPGLASYSSTSLYISHFHTWS